MASAVKLNASLLTPLKFIKGTPVTEPLPNTVYVLEFWATWCPPCRDSIPHLSELQARYKSRGVVFIGISSEDESAVAPFVQRMGTSMDYCVAIDTSKSIASKFQVRGIPQAVVFDTTGSMVWMGHPMDQMPAQIEKALKTQTASSCCSSPSSCGSAAAPSSKAAATTDPLLATLEAALHKELVNQLQDLSARELKQLMASGKVSSSNCLEKSEFVDALQKRLRVHLSFS
mmetsp:Transcript_12757/g.32520  ORF Transcript_12757/g.32520 Transcript_12757/m.32520 type:complete len:230 (-) Transcript_12757:776-1465(-)